MVLPMLKKCPLCNSLNTIFCESIPVAKLNQLWAKSFKLPVIVKTSHMDYLKCQDCNLGFFSPLETGEESLYEALQQHEWYYMKDKEEFKIASTYIESASVLEVGAGGAAFADYVGRENYTGLEFSEAAIRQAKERGIVLIKQSVEEHAAMGKKYDVVVAFQVLEHVSSPQAFLQGCVDCLNPGGRLIIAVPSQDSFFRFAINHCLDMPPHHVTRWSEATLRKISNIFNLKCIKIHHELVADYHERIAKSFILGASIKSKLRIKSHLIDDRFHVKLIGRIAYELSRWVSLDLSKFNGHTIVSIYEKL